MTSKVKQHNLSKIIKYILNPEIITVFTLCLYISAILYFPFYWTINKIISILNSHPNSLFPIFSLLIALIISGYKLLSSRGIKFSKQCHIFYFTLSIIYLVSFFLTYQQWLYSYTTQISVISGVIMVSLIISAKINANNYKSKKVNSSPKKLSKIDKILIYTVPFCILVAIIDNLPLNPNNIIKILANYFKDCYPLYFFFLGFAVRQNDNSDKG